MDKKYKSCIVYYIGDDKEVENILEENADKIGFIKISYNQPITSSKFKRLEPSDIFIN